MQKQKELRCAICKNLIVKTDNYCHLIDYKHGKFYCEEYYHSNCFTDKIQGQQKNNFMKDYAMNILSRADKIIKQAEAANGN